MKPRTTETYKLARHHVADWLKYCRRRGTAFSKNGKFMMCSCCAFDAAANAIEAEQRRIRKAGGDRVFNARKELKRILDEHASYDGVRGERGIVPLRKSLRRVIQMLGGRP